MKIIMHNHRLALLLPVLAGLCLGACKSAPPQAARVPKVTVEWIGCNAFKVTSSLGIVLVTDPFNPKQAAYPVPQNLKASIVTVSHESDLANYSGLLANAPQIIRTNMGVGSNRASGLLVRGVATGGAPGRSDLNVAYSWEMDGVRFCHLGALTGPITWSQVEALGRPDVLFLPVGSPPELDDSGRDKTLQLLQPRLVIPMGYKTRHTSKLNARSPREWLASQPNVIPLASNRFEVSKDSLPYTRAVLVPAIP